MRNINPRQDPDLLAGVSDPSEAELAALAAGSDMTSLRVALLDAQIGLLGRADKLAWQRLRVARRELRAALLTRQILRTSPLGRLARARTERHTAHQGLIATPWAVAALARVAWLGVRHDWR